MPSVSPCYLSYPLPTAEGEQNCAERGGKARTSHKIRYLEREAKQKPANAASARIFQVGNDARRFEHGTQVGLGLRFRQWSFSLRTESANGFSRYIGLNTTLQYRFFMLGYQF